MAGSRGHSARNLAVGAAICIPACLLIPASARAQASGDAPAPSTVPAAPGSQPARSYSAADFARFAPRTAADMIDRVPGFVIREDEEGRRGLGQARTNVLINGERFSGKSNDVVTELGRISASDVARIDIVDGATLNVPGLSGQVANIIVTSTDKLTGTFAWYPQARRDRLPPRLTNGNLSLNGSIGDVDMTFGVTNMSRVNGNAGPEIVTDANGNVIDRREERLDVFVEEPKLSIGLKNVSDGGSTANLNAFYQIYHMDADEWSYRYGPVLPPGFRMFHEQERTWKYELGGDYDFALGKGRLKIIGLRRYAHSPYSQYFRTSFDDLRPDEGQRFDQTSNEAESILRSEYGWKAGPAEWQVAAEGAFNVLDVDSIFFLLDNGGAFQPVPLDNAVSRVEEKRAEINLTYGRPIGPNLTLQASIGGEYSKLSQSGPNGLVRQFWRPKGFASVAWRPDPRLDISAKITREVGQLDFSDFVAFVNVGGGFGNAGNPQLVPAQTWRAEAEATKNFGAWGSATLRAYGELQQDVVDIIPIGPAGEAPGNLDRARLYGLFIKATANLDPMGIKGARIDVEGRLQKSGIRDPLTNEKREINDLEQRYLSISVRHDIAGSDWAYGGSYEEFQNAWSYRLGLRERAANDPGGVGLYVENKDVIGLTMRLSLDNLLGTQEQFTRSYYRGRRTGGLDFTEFRDREYGPILTISISGSI